MKHSKLYLAGAAVLMAIAVMAFLPDFIAVASLLITSSIAFGWSLYSRMLDRRSVEVDAILSQYDQYELRKATRWVGRSSL
jgi:hypothetical protein